jgi:hypothetical protein
MGVSHDTKGERMHATSSDAARPLCSVETREVAHHDMASISEV